MFCFVFLVRYMLQSASEINSSNDDKMGKRPRSHYSEMNHETSTSGGKLDTSFESYFGVERSASNSDVVRIRVPYSRDDALNQMKKATSTQDNTNTTNTDQNKIRISVPQNSSNGNNKLEDTFNAKLVMKNHLHNHTNSNSKSMTNL